MSHRAATATAPESSITSRPVPGRTDHAGVEFFSMARRITC